MTRDDSSADPDQTEADEPTLADRVEASEDFGAAIEQSTALLVQYRRILLILILVSLVIVIVMILSY